MHAVSNHPGRALGLALVIAVIVLGDASANARKPRDRSVDLDAAQRALDNLRYEEARPLLERAWHSGQNGPQALALLFRLQGEVAATLGDEPAARRAYARWLALEPSARLDEGTSPKLATAFEAARRQLEGAALRVDVAVARDGAAVVLVVVSDPLAMIAGARASYRSQAGVQGVVEGKGDLRIELPLPTAGDFRVVVAAVDGFGNRLIDHEIVVDAPQPAKPGRTAPAASRSVPVPTPVPPPAPVPAPPPRRAPAPPIYASPWLWSSVSAGFVIAGGVFAWRASDAQSQLDDLNANSAQHSFAEARLVEDRLGTNAMAANLGFAAAGACAVVALVLALESPHSPASAHLSLRPALGGGRVTFEWSF